MEHRKNQVDRADKKAERFMIFIFVLGFFVMTIVTAILITVADGAEIEISNNEVSYKMDAIKPANAYAVKIISKSGLYLGYETERFMLYGQDMGIDSLSVGYRHHLYPFLYFYGQAGYYRPDYDPTKFGREAIYMAIAEEYRYTNFSMHWSDHYELHLRPDFGAEAGIGIKYPLWKGLSVSASLGYRYLKMWADYDGLDNLGRQDWIMSRQDDFSATKVLVGLGYEF